MAIQIGGGIRIGGGIGFSTGAPVAGGGGGTGYPTINSSDEVFKFNYNTLAASADLIADVSANAWTKSPGSRGSTGLTQPSGGAYSDGGYYYRNASTGGNNECLQGLYSSTYATYHNNNVPAASWSFETNVYFENKVSFDSGWEAQLVGLSSGVGISVVASSATAYNIKIILNSTATTGVYAGPTITCADLTGNAWKHLVVTADRTAPGYYTFYVFVNGVLQNTGGTSYNFTGYVGTTAGLWAHSTFGLFIGSTTWQGTNPYIAYGLDNTRLILGKPFNLTGFTAPTSAFTA